MKILEFVAAVDFPVDIDKTGIPQVEANQDTVAGIMQFVFVLVGAVSVLMIVLAGIRYIVSTGNPQNTAQAKNAIIYSVVGLIVAISAYILVEFIIKRVG